jgi:2-polyprenyl-3-methyl-5-hydroxy-6-metoxy-1,4-benzoquinol methylase
MLKIEQQFGMRSIWYFRWRTARASVIAAVRETGGQVGLHYETLTRLVLEQRLDPSQIDDTLIRRARELLRREIAEFNRAFGPIRSVCAHGDTRVPGVTNQLLMTDQAAEAYGIAFDANAALDRQPPELWLTDRSAADGRWKDGLDPVRVLEQGTSPILLLVHPNNWCSGASLWSDRACAAVLPTPRAGARKGPLITARTGSDAPPPLPVIRAASRPASPHRVREFEPIAESLRREVLRFSYESGASLADPSGINTLLTNSALAESRASTLEYVLAEAGWPALDGLDVLDLGSGFGALALVFAARGARVLAVDPNGERAEVGKKVAVEHGLAVRFQQASMEELAVDEGSFDVAILNNSLCYVIARADRREALERVHRALRPGGALVVRNPNRWHPRDQFTGIPLLGLLPPRLAQFACVILRRHRSRVRLLSHRAARRELRRAGFEDVRSVRRPRESRLRAMFAGYQHLSARHGQGA